MAAFGDPGHAFPAIALARALAEARARGGGRDLGALARGGRGRRAWSSPRRRSTGCSRRRDPTRREGADAAEAARALLPLLEEMRPHAVVSDILTLAPALAAEVAGVPRATLIPHIYPVHEPGLPFFAIGAQPPRTAVGRALWRRAQPVLDTGLRRGRRELNQQRARLGLAPLERFHGGISPELALVATFPQLEYPRRWPAGVEVTGPMTFELPYPDIELPPGRGAAGPGRAEHRPRLREPAGAGGAGGAGRGAGAGGGDDQPRGLRRAATRCRRTPSWSTGSATAS